MLIYVNSSLRSSLVNIDTNFNENLFIRINDEIIISNIYRSLSSKAENDEELCKLIAYTIFLTNAHTLSYLAISILVTFTGIVGQQCTIGLTLLA